MIESGYDDVSSRQYTLRKNCLCEAKLYFFSEVLNPNAGDDELQMMTRNSRYSSLENPR